MLAKSKFPPARSTAVLAADFGGSASDAMILSNGILVVDGGSASNITVSSGGEVDVFHGQIQGAIFNAGASEFLLSGGIDSGAVIRGIGGNIDDALTAAQLISRGGAAFDTVL